MTDGIDQELTRRYLERRVDDRIVALIDRELAGAGSVVDVGCGAGLYGPALRRRVASVVGVDHDPVLCGHARATGAYDRVVCDRAERLPVHVQAADVLFCSEVLEHVPDAELDALLRAIEAVAVAKVVITVPNRLSPHARMDPTHVLRYSLGSLRRRLDRSAKFRYSLHPLGFAEEWRRRPWCRPLDLAARRVALLSPTVLYLGRRR
jgi:SAM-dependent methyltransferase